jgi:O-antigen/teichoic acid export membrane protein
VSNPDVLDTGRAGGMAIRGGVLRTLGYFAAMLMSLVSVPLMTRHLGVEDFGRFITVSSIIFIIGGVTEAGLTNLGMRDYALLEPAERARFLRNLAGLRFALTVSGVAFAVLLTWVTGAEAVVVQGTAIAGAGLLLALTQQTYSIPLSAQLRLGWVTGLELFKQSVLTGGFVLLVVAGATLLPFFAASVVAGAAVLALTLFVVRDEKAARPLAEPETWRRILRDVLPYAVATAVGLIYFRLAVVLMSYVASDHETGIYSTAFRIVEVVAVIPWLVVSAGFPILARAARDDEDRLRYALQRLFEVSLMVGAGIALALALGASFAVDVIGGLPEFEDSVPVLRMLALALVTSFLVATWSFALLSLHAHRDLLVCNAVAAIVAAAGTPLLAPELGAMGAAIATVGAEAVLAAGYLIALRRRRPALRPELGVVPKVVLAAGLGAAVALLPLHAAAEAVLGAALFLAALFVLRAVPPELLNALRGVDPEPS